MRLTRRAFLSATTALALTGPVSATGAVEMFSPDDVVAMARALAERPFRLRKQVPEDWRNLSYEQYRKLWFRPTEALWFQSDAPYEVDFFAPGLYFPRPIKVYEVSEGQATAVPFDLSKFDRTDKFPDVTLDDSLGYSGLRLRTELTEPGKKNEFCVFQGASYFRAIGHDMIYGLSARGLALKTGDPAGEEFPEFTHFWLERPAPGQNNIVIHALMDSLSVTGAYRFDIAPGPECVMDVTAEIFARERLTHVGIGPLTSMFLFDETVPTRFDDFRPAVHDSDGLLVWNGAGERLWRPLANPRTLQISAFGDNNPRGFGLMQRARKFSDFNDLEALYHRRPGLWVEPKGDWGEGSVSLVEIPADQEIYDNIVAYWRPRKPMAAGDNRKLEYRLTWGTKAPVEQTVAEVIGTAMGARHAWANPPQGRMAFIDFAPHPAFEDGPDAIDIFVSSPHVDTTPGILQRNPETGGMRLAFSFDPKEREMVELRAQLRKDGVAVSEVWLYRWTA
ncbi:MAG: glucan biosynthesis protein [Arenibacterium sp.]